MARIDRGDQRRSARMLLQVLSLATPDPETYGTYARTAVEVMLDPISDALVSVGFGRRDTHRLRPAGSAPRRAGHPSRLPYRCSRRTRHRSGRRGRVMLGAWYEAWLDLQSCCDGVDLAPLTRNGVLAYLRSS